MLSKNLRVLCAERGTIASACRDMGINQQQFNKYLNGTTLPSDRLLHIISQYFGLPRSELFLEAEDFSTKRTNRSKQMAARRVHPLDNAFTGSLGALRPLCGRYLSYGMSPSWPDSVLISAYVLYEQESQFFSTAVERGKAPDKTKTQRTRYDGKVTMHSGRIFVMEMERAIDSTISETILYPPYRQQRNYLRGMTFGLSWRPRRTPYCSRVIWRRVEGAVSDRDFLEQCGVFDINNRSIGAVVRNFLEEKTNFTGEQTSS